MAKIVTINLCGNAGEEKSLQRSKLLRLISSEDACNHDTFTESITCNGISLYTNPIGTRLSLGKCVVEITQTGSEIPCAEKKCSATPHCVLVRVIKGGKIKAGDSVRMLHGFEGWLICSDIDGTLISSKGTLSDENRTAIEYFMQNGGLFTVSTGRFPEYINNFELKPNAPTVAVNGTVLYDLSSGKMLYNRPLLHNYADVVRYVCGNYDSVDYVKGCCIYDTIEFDLPEPEKLIELFEQNDIHKIVMHSKTVEMAETLRDDLRSRFGDRFSFSRSWPFGLELQMLSTGKGECIQKLCEILDVPIHTSVGVGDFENDISMLKLTDIGCATANAIDSVKDAADIIVPSNDENAIAHIIKEIEKGTFGV